MKKTLSIAFALALVLTSLLSLSVFAEDYTEDGKPIAKAVYGSPAVDAYDIDPLWDNAPEYVGEKIRTTVTAEDTNTRFTFRLMWDEEKLYVLEKVTDISVQTYNPEHTYANDSTEICLSLNANTGDAYNYEYDGWVGFTPHENTYTDWGGDSTMFGTEALGADLAFVEHSAAYDETGYVICVAFDIKSINSTVAWGENTKIGFEVSVNDSAITAGERVLCLGWADDTDAACDKPSTFGVVYLVNNKDSQIPSGDAPVEPGTSTEPTESEDASEATSEDASTEATSEDASTEATSEAASEAASEEVSEKESEAPTSSTGNENPGDSGFPTWIIFVIIGVVVVAVVVVVVMKKK